MSTSKKLRVAVIGTGFIGRVHVRSARMAGAEVVGVADAQSEIAEEAAKLLGTPKAYRTPADAIQDKEVDVIHVCTPNAFHRQYSEEALKAGKHVVCEKPLATSAADAEAVTKLARDKGLIATVPFVYRFHPMVREARARVMSGELGSIHLIHGTYLQDWLLQASDTNWRVDAKMGGPSRAFADIGSHWCDLVEWVTGHRFSSLSALKGTTIKSRAAGQVEAFKEAKLDESNMQVVTTEDLACVLLKTNQGAYGSVVLSQVSAGRKNRLWFEIDGAKQSAAFDQEQPETLWLGRREHTLTVRRDPGHGSPEARRLTIFPAGHAQGWGDCFEAFTKDTYATINGAKMPEGLPTFEDGYRSAKITDAVLKSAAANSWVDIP